MSAVSFTTSSWTWSNCTGFWVSCERVAVIPLTLLHFPSRRDATHILNVRKASNLVIMVHCQQGNKRLSQHHFSTTQWGDWNINNCIHPTRPSSNGWFSSVNNCLTGFDKVSCLSSHGAGRLPLPESLSQCCSRGWCHPGHVLLPEGAQGKSRTHSHTH